MDKAGGANMFAQVAKQLSKQIVIANRLPDDVPSLPAELVEFRVQWRG
jgi:hypothetical protein